VLKTLSAIRHSQRRKDAIRNPQKAISHQQLAKAKNPHCTLNGTITRWPDLGPFPRCTFGDNKFGAG
jgi:hypothetical protein